jgi:hypothetical protein
MLAQQHAVAVQRLHIEGVATGIEHVILSVIVGVAVVVIGCLILDRADDARPNHGAVNSGTDEHILPHIEFIAIQLVHRAFNTEITGAGEDDVRQRIAGIAVIALIAVVLGIKGCMVIYSNYQSEKIKKEKIETINNALKDPTNGFRKHIDSIYGAENIKYIKGTHLYYGDWLFVCIDIGWTDADKKVQENYFDIKVKEFGNTKRIVNAGFGVKDKFVEKTDQKLWNEMANELLSLIKKNIMTL